MTDGRRVSSTVVQIWLDRSFVGWKADGHVEVVIDLRQVHTLDLVTVSAVVSISVDVKLLSMMVAVSDDATDFRIVLIVNNIRVTQRSRAMIRIEALHTGG